MMNRTTNGRGKTPFPGIAAVAALLALPLAACDLDELVRVEDPELVPPGELEGEDGLPFLIDGAVGDFIRAYAGGSAPSLHNEGIITTSGAMSDELYQSDTFITRNQTDRRNQNPFGQSNTTDVTYLYLQQARRALRDAAEAVEEIAGSDDARIPEVRSLEGYTWIAFGENWCSNVPMSRAGGDRGLEVTEGDPVTTEGLFQGAVDRFDMALAVDDTDQLAAVGRGRALLNLGDYEAAAAAVAEVPTTFVYFAPHSDNTSRQNNAVWVLQGNGRWSMSDEEGENGLAFRSAMDPRTPWNNTRARGGVGFDGSTPLFFTDRYPNQESNVVLADGIEARLIEAEAAWHNGGDWLGILNALREDAFELMDVRYDDYEDVVRDFLDLGPTERPEMDPLEDPGTPAEQIDLIFQERGFWMYLTGHRLGDLRRLMREYDRSQDDVFPVGDHIRGNTYQNDVAFMMPFDEENNPEYDGSLCDVTQP